MYQLPTLIISSSSKTVLATASDGFQRDSRPSGLSVDSATFCGTATEAAADLASATGIAPAASLAAVCATAGVAVWAWTRPGNKGIASPSAHAQELIIRARLTCTMFPLKDWRELVNSIVLPTRQKMYRASITGPSSLHIRICPWYKNKVLSASSTHTGDCARAVAATFRQSVFPGHAPQI